MQANHKLSSLVTESDEALAHWFLTLYASEWIEEAKEEMKSDDSSEDGASDPIQSKCHSKALESKPRKKRKSGPQDSKKHTKLYVELLTNISSLREKEEMGAQWENGFHDELNEQKENFGCKKDDNVLSNLKPEPEKLKIPVKKFGTTVDNIQSVQKVDLHVDAKMASI